MTRINCVPVEELSQPHLIAEYRELPRIFGLVQRAIVRGEQPVKLDSYRLGAGHCKFFYTRLTYLAERHKELVAEMKRRGYRPQYTASLKDSFSSIPEEWWGNWKPDEKALEINRRRIEERSKD